MAGRTEHDERPIVLDPRAAPSFIAEPITTPFGWLGWMEISPSREPRCASSEAGAAPERERDQN